MGLQASSRAITFVLLGTLLVHQGASEQSKCDYSKYAYAYHGALSRLHFKVTGQPINPETQEYHCKELREVARAPLDIGGCTYDQNVTLNRLKSDFGLFIESFCDDGLRDGMDLWSDYFSLKEGVVAECQRKVNEQLDKLVADGAILEGDKHCRNKTQSYQCVLQVGADCPPAANVAKRAVEKYINISLDLDQCSRPTGLDCDNILFYDCYWFTMSRIKFKDHVNPDDVLLKADSLADDCKAAESVSTCTRNVVIDKCPEQERTQLRALQDGFITTRDSLCKNTEQLRGSINEWNRCINKEALQKCSSKVEELVRNLPLDDTTKISEPPYCRERAEKLKCALKAAESCPSSAGPAKKAFKDYELSQLDKDMCLRPNLDDLYDDTGFSTTPKMDSSLRPDVDGHHGDAGFSTTPKMDSSLRPDVDGHHGDAGFSTTPKMDSSLRPDVDGHYGGAGFSTTPKMDSSLGPDVDGHYGGAGFSTTPKMDSSLRPDGHYGDAGFSTTPKIFVTLGALCIALLPTKQILLQHFS